jgi:hypothetical protein
MTSKQQYIWQELCLKAVMEPDPQCARFSKPATLARPSQVRSQDRAAPATVDPGSPSPRFLRIPSGVMLTNFERLWAIAPMKDFGLEVSCRYYVFNVQATAN